jgi:predicted amidohydrolase
MAKYDIYSAVAVQPEIKSVEDRSDIQRNMKRTLELIDVAPQVSLTAKSSYSDPCWAPIKLVSFPEFFLQGHEGSWPYQHYLDNVLIELPGEETEQLAKKAKEYEIYIAGCALERDEWIKDGYFWNTHFIIDPKGKIIHKYRKLTLATHYELAVSPHDVYDKYIAEKGDSLSTFFPVTDTEIGKIGTITCMDGHFPENSRALGQQGAEIILHPLLVDPLLSPPYEIWQMMNRLRGYENVAYVVSASWGSIIGKRPKYFTPGKAMISDFNGKLLAYADYPGESMVSAVINLEELRRRRLDPSRNYPTMLRNEIYRKIYEKEVYPANTFDKHSPRSRVERDSMATIKKFLADGIFTAPGKMPHYLK